MPNITFVPHKYNVMLMCDKYPNVYMLANKCNGFLQNRSNYFKLNTIHSCVFYIFSTFSEVMTFYRNIIQMYPLINYSYTVIKSGKTVNLK